MPAEEGEKKGKTIQIKPGDNPAVEVPQEACESVFVQNLLKEGMLREEAAAVSSLIVSEDELDLLRMEAESLGIEVKDSWAMSTLKKKIAAAKK